MGWGVPPQGVLGSPWRGLQSRRHLTGGRGSGNAANARQDRFATDGAEEGALRQQALKQKGVGVERTV